jgi:type II secretory pathway pseudopilin PulG
MSTNNPTKKSSKFKQAEGFTLVEMLVAVGLFIIVMVVSMGSLVAVVGADRRAQAIETVVNNLDFALDDMARTIRTGDNFHCRDGAGAGGAQPDLSNISAPQDCQSGSFYMAVEALPSRVESVYWFNSSCGGQYPNGCIEKRTSVDRGVTWSDWFPLTSPELNIKFNTPPFYVVGSQPPNFNDFLQPKATVLLTAQIPTEKGTVTLHLQTSMTQRLYDTN